MTTDRGNDLKKKKLRARKKERTEQAILIAAEEFFSKRPMDEVNLEEIAEAAFVSRTTLYNYFKNKDAIFFELGIRQFIAINDYNEENFPNDLTGFDQYMQLVVTAFEDGIAKPLIFSILREFFARINQSDISLKEWAAEIKKGVGRPRFERFLKEIEEPYLVRFYSQLLRNRDTWIKVIKKGKADGTIVNELEESHIAQFAYMFMSGMAEEIKLRDSELDLIGLKPTTLFERIQDLISAFARNP
ncbi:MAG: TetR/AcrR family transcriptional regulator [Candidatus Thorarchaeota archaeon]|nr:MAG: TetR/AcrR family transcriptional regulator [Candidatus Thorarchaeota archaeon]